MSKVEFQDFSFAVKAAINEATTAWLQETADTIASRAAETCQMDDTGRKLAGSYRADVNDGKGQARIGSPLESAYWEEYGTGSYADQSKNGGKAGRAGWWVYVKDSETSSTGGKTYATKEEAEMVAESMRAEGLDAYATNGRKPNYTLEKAFKSVKPKAIARLNDMLKEATEE